MDSFIDLSHPFYPKLLQQSYNPPEKLFYRGNLELLKRPKFAIVGTRRASAWGLRYAKEFSREIASNGFVVVSGLAFGIDAAAHEASLEHGHTIAVLAHGLDPVQPRAHHALAEKILAQGGLLLSENSKEGSWQAQEYLKRNRIIAGLCQGVLLVEAPLKSGAMNTLAHARAMSRDIFTIPVRPDDFGQGNLACLKQFGIPISRAQDILEYYGVFSEIRQQHVSKQHPILKLLQERNYRLEELVDRLNMPPQMIQEQLFSLEMEQKIYKNFHQEYEWLASQDP